MENKEKILNDYIALRSLDCRCKDGVTNYERYLKRFLNSFDSFDSLTERDLIDYSQKLSKKFSQTTINIINPLLKNFIKWKYRDYSLKFPMLDRILRTKKSEPTKLVRLSLAATRFTRSKPGR